MLKLLRKKKVAKRIFYVLAAIIIPAFVIWGSASVINKDKTPAYAGIIFGRKVSFDDFRQALYAWRLQIKLQYGDKAEEMAASFLNPTQGAWDRLIALHEVKKRKIRVSDAAVVNAITQMPFLQRDNRFDPQVYALFLKYGLGVSAHTFESQLRENLSMARLFQQITKDVRISDDEIREAYARQNEQTRIRYAFFPAQGYQNQILLTEEEINAYYEKTKDKLKVPPQVNIAYIFLPYPEDATDKQKDDIKRKMDDSVALARSKGLSEAAKKLNTTVGETGLFAFEDPIPSLGWLPQLSEFFFNASAGTTTDAVETNRGVFIFHIKEKKDAYVPQFKEAREKAKEALINEKSREIALQKAREFLAQIPSPEKGSFEKAGQKAGVPIKETPLFSRASYIPGIGLAEALKEAAFGLKEDGIAPEPVALENGFYGIQSIETVGVDEEKFKKEKEEFGRMLLEQKRAKSFDDFFEDLKKKAHLVSHVSERTTKEAAPGL